MSCTEDTSTVTLSTSSGVLEADVNISTQSGNTIVVEPDGLFVGPVAARSGFVADATTTPQTIMLSAGATYLLAARMWGVNCESRLSAVVHVPHFGNLNVAWEVLLQNDFTLGTIVLETEDGGAQWAINASSNGTIKVLFENIPSGAGSAAWALTATALI